MIGWKIFSHSLSMVLRNLGWALQIALVPVLMAMVCIVALLWGQFGELLDNQGRLDYVPSGGLVTSILLSVVIFIAAELWVFVSWHRFVLLEEYPTGWIPKFHGDRILAYFGTSLLLGLVIILAWIVIIGVLSFLSMMFNSIVLITIIPIIGLLPLGVFLFRLLPTLPAAAIGEKLSFSESMAATKGTAGTAIVLFLVLILIQILLQLITNVSIYVFAPLGLVFAVVSALIMTLVNVSILTTIYGHYVQGRAI
ncbi:hypothetical protein [Tritonibacter mobilis]|uniref:hypothetical protein n=1 Tax=Tritonibacter mobilis TaxID=379347 RepID=UPI000806ACC4|nr:hypothetical protein [Tritonibacter mobilis]